MTIEYVSKKSLIELQIAVGEWLARLTTLGEELLVILEKAGR